MIKTIYANHGNLKDFFTEMKKRNAEADEKIMATVKDIISHVREKGDQALIQYGEAFDGGFPEKFIIEGKEIKEAYDKTSPDFIEALEKAAENIRDYHENQVQESYQMGTKPRAGLGKRGSLEEDNYTVLGQMVRPLSKVGIYVPGGTAAYPSTVLMNGIPAKIAGVEEIVMVTPPAVTIDGDGNKSFGANPDILAAAHVAGVNKVYLTGGAQSIAALAFGTESVPMVDKIVGPGNAYVATAKRLVYGQVDIDMIAGPSEILIIADETGNPEFIAADLMSQAEHDKMAAAILLTTEEDLAKKTLKALERQLEQLGRQEIIEASLRDYGAIIICESLRDMIKLSNEIAPEHLEIMTKDPMRLLPQIENAGSVFCGSYAPEPLGDYYSGTNHVLPTSGTARFSSPLGVYSFVKKISYTYYSEEALRKAEKHIVTIAEKEGLTAHANSIKVRFK